MELLGGEIRQKHIKTKELCEGGMDTEKAAAPPPKLHKADAAESVLFRVLDGERSSEPGTFKSRIIEL